MAVSRPNDLQIETAKGDGNCAFNAFVLAFSHPDVLNHFDQNPQEIANFISDAARVLDVANNWATVKAKILELRQADKSSLQLKLAPIMRLIALTRAEKDLQHIARTKEPLFSAFRDYVSHELGIQTGPVADDIYKRHDFIIEKFDQYVAFLNNSLVDRPDAQRALARFKELHAQNDNSAEFQALEFQFDNLFAKMQQDLYRWWQQQGYARFLQAMKVDGTWAGDLELLHLANYFHVNLNVQRGDFTHHIYLNHGALPVNSDQYRLAPATIKQLADRGIIDRPQPAETQLTLLPLQYEQADALLHAVPDYAKVAADINAQQAPLKGKPLRTELSDACIEQLKARDVIKPDADGAYVYNLFAEDALERIGAVKEADNILAVWDVEHLELPTVTLSNQYAGHWDNMTTAVPEDAEMTLQEDVLAALEEQAQTVAAAKQLREQSEQKWKALLGEARNRSASPFSLFNYFVSEQESIKVSEDMQYDLDEALAEKLQLEEYEEYKNSLKIS